MIQCLIEMLRAYIALGVCSHQGVEAGKVVYTCQKLAKARTLAEEISEWVLCGGQLLRRTERRSYRKTSDVSHTWLRMTLSALTPQGGARKAERGVVFELLPVNGAQRVMASTTIVVIGAVVRVHLVCTNNQVVGSGKLEYKHLQLVST